MIRLRIITSLKMFKAIKYNITGTPFFLLLMLLVSLSTGNVQELNEGHQIFHFHGEDQESLIGGVLKCLGDINDDGFDDIAFSSGVPKGSYIFLGGNPVDSIPDFFLNNVSRVGDFLDYNGDNIPDIVASSDSAIYLYQLVGGLIDTTPIDSILVPTGLHQIALMDAKDINGDSIGDILVRAKDPYEGHQVLLYYNPFTSDSIPDWLIQIQDYSHSVNTLGFIDFNDDDTLDVFLSKHAYFDSLGYVDIYCGPIFNGIPDYIIGHPVEFDTLDFDRFAYEAYNLGDIDGDLYDDLGILSIPDGLVPLVYSGGPSADTVYDYWPDGSCYHMANAGDINNDGFDELVIGGADGSFGRVIIYLGGPQFDTIRDDVINRSDLPPLFLEYIGFKVASAGDFNGDGFDDIFFMCRNFAGGSPNDVFVFSWGDDVTSVEEDHSKNQLPEDFILGQNYPNPFNPSTTIEFELPRKDVVTLEIYNCLGQCIARPIVDKALSAGNHVIHWNGKMLNGNRAPSGVFFYKLKGNRIAESRKMILLK